MLIHFANGREVFINFREEAPKSAHKNMYLDKQGKVISSPSCDRILKSTQLP